MPDIETEFRRRKYEQIARAQASDEDRRRQLAQGKADRAQRRPEALEILGELRESRDAEVFRAQLQAWVKKPGFGGFDGFNGQMFVHQVVKKSEDKRVIADLLFDVLSAPTNEQEARSKIQRFVEYVDTIKKGGHPAPKRVPFVTSFFWAIQDHDQWPCLWNSAENMLVRLGWLALGPDHPTTYLNFRSIVLSLGETPDDVEYALYWFENHLFTGLDPALVDRCVHNIELNSDQEDPAIPYPDPASANAAERNARAILGDLTLLGLNQETSIAQVLGRSVKVTTPKLTFTDAGRFRSDGWVAWRVREVALASLRVWVNGEGVAIGLHPGWLNEGWYDKASAAIQPHLPSQVEWFALSSSPLRIERAGSVRPTGEFFVGRWFPKEDALDRTDFADDVLTATAELKPAMDELARLAGGPTTSGQTRVDDPLTDLVAEFRVKRGYPGDKDSFHIAERKSMAKVLSADELEVMDLSELRSIYNSNRYGGPGPQSVLNRTLRDASPVELEKFAANLRYLLWDEDDPDEQRIDRSLDFGDRGVKGLGESVIMKLLAITHPDRYVPVFPYTGDMGKVKLMRLIGLTPPAADLTRGEKQVQANDLIRQRLDPFFPGDPWGQGQFLYWLRTQGEAPQIDPISVLDDVADEFLVDRAFVQDIAELLRDKGQVVFYGPPGTGKTYLALRLAAALAPDPARRMLVQFHPSSSYEDFFEGYRPEGGEDGSLTYRLTPGPLARLAAKAEAAPGIDHVMVIDEINRANLPKVFGELLFLLEYRDHRVMTLYRPEEGFELPPNLYFIATMNTADRSIAIIDAAMRRRFHFIPFFPHEGPMAGLLERWLEEQDEPRWIGELVGMVNVELIRDLGGPHLQIGPSHFMKNGLDEQQVARIWAYNVFPYIEDQLFGQPARLREYEFGRVLARYRADSGASEAALSQEEAHSLRDDSFT